MSVDVHTDLGVLRKCEGDIWLLWCPVCEDWEKLNEMQIEGQLSVNHAATGCPSQYHETHNFAVEVVAKIQAYRLMGQHGPDPVVRHASERPPAFAPPADKPENATKEAK